MSDGASVNFGVKSGLLTKLKNDKKMPWIIGIHCLNHRLELADATAHTSFDSLCTLLSNIHSIFEHSPKRLRALKDLAELMGEDAIKPARTNGTRWVQHKLKAATILLKQYGIIILALSNISDDAKIKGYVKQMTSFKTLALLHLFVDFLAPVGKLSDYLQGDSTNLLLAQSAVEAALLAFTHTSNTEYSEQLTKLVSTAKEKLDEGAAMEFQSVYITDLRDGISALQHNAESMSHRLSEELTSRFGDIFNQSTPNSVLTALKLLNIREWPESKEGLYEFGNVEMTVVVQHFAEILCDKLDTAEVPGEWLQLKICV